MTKAGLTLFMLALALLWLTGCKEIDQRKQTTLLQDTLATYGAAMRWSEFSTVYGYKKREEGERIEIPKNLKNIRVTAYDVRHAPVMYDEVTAIQSADIEYVLRDRQAVKKLTDRQVWLFDAEKMTWQLISEIPVFE